MAITAVHGWPRILGREREGGDGRREGMGGGRNSHAPISPLDGSMCTFVWEGDNIAIYIDSNERCTVGLYQVRHHQTNNHYS